MLCPRYRAMKDALSIIGDVGMSTKVQTLM